MAFIGRPNLQEGMYAKLIDLIGRRPNLLAQGVNELGNVFGAFVGSRYDRERAEQLRQQLAGEKYGANVVGLIEKDRLGPPISRGASDTIPTAVGGISLADLRAAIGGVSPTQARGDVYKSMVGTMGPTTMDLAKARGYKGDIGEARKILPDEDKAARKEIRDIDLKIAKIRLRVAEGKKGGDNIGEMLTLRGQLNQQIKDELDENRKSVLEGKRAELDTGLKSMGLPIPDSDMASEIAASKDAVARGLVSQDEANARLEKEFPGLAQYKGQSGNKKGWMDRVLEAFK